MCERALAAGRLTAVLIAVLIAAIGAGCVGDYQGEDSGHGALIPAIELRHDRPFKKAVLTWFAKGARLDGEADAAVYFGGGPALSLAGDLKGQVVRVGTELSRFYGPKNEYAIGLSFGLVNYGQQRFEDGAGTGSLEEDGWNLSFFVLDPGLSFRARLGHGTLLRAEWHATAVAGGIDVEETALLAEVRLGPGASLTVGWRSLETRFPDDLADGVRFEVAGPTAGIVVAF